MRASKKKAVKRSISLPADMDEAVRLRAGALGESVSGYLLKLARNDLLRPDGDLVVCCDKRRAKV